MAASEPTGDAEKAALLGQVAKLETANAALRGELANERDNGRFLASIVENLPDMIFVKEAADLKFVRFNAAGERLLGRDRRELIGKSDRDFFPPNEADFFIGKDREVLASGKLLDIPEEPIHTPHGVRTLHTKKIPILADDGTPRFLLGISEDITDRKSDAEHLARQTAELAQANAEVIRVLADTMAALSTPLLPIHRGVLVMPLIGGVDAERMGRALDVVLAGVASSAAKVVILDITGVWRLDDGVADGLTRVAKAVRLLGAELVITGIGAETAHTLGKIRSDWSGIVTRARLEAGVAYALAAVGSAR